MRIIKGKMKGKKVTLEAGRDAAQGRSGRSDGTPAPEPRPGGCRNRGAKARASKKAPAKKRTRAA